MFFVGNLRDRPRNFTSSHYSVGNYSTDIKMKSEIKEYSDDLFQNLHLIPDPLKKNLADQFTNVTKMEHIDQESTHTESTLSGITNFISGVFNVLSSAMFRRSKTEDGQQMASDWHSASDECKNGLSDHINIGDDIKKEMSDCRTAVSKCEDKLNEVRLLLNSRTSSSPVKFRSRRPRRVFVEPSSIKEHFQDAFSPEEYVNLANESFIEYYSPLQYQSPEYFDAQSPNMQIHLNKFNETIEIGNQLPENNVNVNNTCLPDVNKEKCLLNQCSVEKNVSKDQIISSCEDKLTKLKALLQENRKKNTSLQTIKSESSKCTDSTNNSSKSIPIAKTKDKRFKNPNRLCDKRKKSQMKQSIQDELLFAQEVFLDQLSFEESPNFHSLEKIYEEVPFSPSSATPEYFDEITGKFCTSNSSEDSFQIVFNDIPRLHRLSDCDSEDSFIVFDDSPDSCYTSNDVFGDSDSESDSDSDLSDSGCANIKLSANLSRTVSNLTDDSLYSEDVVDFAKSEDEGKRSGLLVNDSRKEAKRGLPPKKVQFSSAPPKVHVMRVWAFAARQARAGHWERYAVDRERFKRRIADVDVAVSWVLKPQHRSRVMFQRFMPWWNAEKRKELAEKKKKEQDERLRIEEENKNELLKIEMEKEEEKRLKIEEEKKEGSLNIEEEKAEITLRIDEDKKEEHLRVKEQKERLNDEEGCMDSREEEKIVIGEGNIEADRNNVAFGMINSEVDRSNLEIESKNDAINPNRDDRVAIENVDNRKNRDAKDFDEIDEKYKLINELSKKCNKNDLIEYKID